MKDFFSEYGWIVAIAVLIAIVIAMQTPLGTALKNSITTIIADFTAQIKPTPGA